MSKCYWKVKDALSVALAKQWLMLAWEQNKVAMYSCYGEAMSSRLN